MYFKCVLLSLMSGCLICLPGIGSVDQAMYEFCSETKLDSVFNIPINETVLTRNDYIWIFNENKGQMVSPAKVDYTQRFELHSMAYISTVPKCVHACEDIQKVKGLIIMLYKKKSKEFLGSYQVKKVVDNAVTKVDNTSLPFGLKVHGLIFSPKESFWPKELSSSASSLDTSHTSITYNPMQNEFIVLANGKTNGYICYNTLKAEKVDWSQAWKCSQIDNNWIYSAIFIHKNNVYVLGLKGDTNRLFAYTNHEMIDTYINIQHFMGCNATGISIGVRSRSAFGDSGPRKKSSSGTGIWLFICLPIVLIIILTVVLMVFLSVRHKAAKKKKQRDKLQNPKMVNKKGRVVSETDIGALDSKVSWGILVAHQSDEDIPPAHAPQPPTSPRNPSKSARPVQDSSRYGK